MKKMIFAGLVISMMGLNAHAGSVSADLRADYDSTSYNDDASKGGVSKFYIQTGRLDFKGNLNEDVSYRFRVRFTKNRVVSQRDNVGLDTDYAYISNKISDGLVLTIGKMASEVGGYEGNTSGADIFLPSTAYAGANTLYNDGKIAGLSSLLYYTGAQIAYNFTDTQKLSLQVANTEGTVGQGYTSGTGAVAGTGDVVPQNKTLTALIYRGGFVDKTFNILATYHMETAGDKDNKIALAALGFEYLLGDFTAQLDLLANTFDRAGATVTKDTFNSTILLVKYKMNQWTPSLKYAMADEKLGGVTTDIKNKYTDYGATLEYTPKADQVFRYHVAYNVRSVSPDSANTTYGSKTPSSTEVIVGTRILADFLK